jgi:hypothetical protein
MLFLEDLFDKIFGEGGSDRSAESTKSARVQVPPYMLLFPWIDRYVIDIMLSGRRVEERRARMFDSRWNTSPPGDFSIHRFAL